MKNLTYSTTRHAINADTQEMAALVKQSNKPDDKVETVLFQPGDVGRQGEGGLRTKGYFKVGGIITESTVLAIEAKQSSADSLTPHASPLITVITVVFNGEKFLEETILSVINQTYDNVEYIIIDGGSTDSTLEIIKKYEHAIDYWVSEKDKGIYDAMNKGVCLSQGKWVSFLNAADSYNLEALTHFSHVLKSTHFGLYVASCRYLSENEVLYVHHPNGFSKNEVLPHPAMISDRNFFSKYGLFDLKFRVFADAVWAIQVRKSEVVFFDDFVFTSMTYGGVSSSITPKFLNECYRFRRINNGFFYSIFLGIFKPYFGCILNLMLGVNYYHLLKKKIT